MLKGKVRVINRLGLHARAAAQLVRLAADFQSNIEIRRTESDADADAKSILSVLTLAAAQGTELEYRVEGIDETEAAENIKKLFADGFGEL